MSNLEFKPGRTAIHRKTESEPCRLLICNGFLDDCTILDYGCGYGKDVEVLRSLGFDANGYDLFVGPYCKDIYVLEKLYQRVLCTYVLNVVVEDTELQILRDIAELLEDDGVAYVTVRRDIREGITWIDKKDGSFHLQRMVRLPFYVMDESKTRCIYQVHKDELLKYVQSKLG